MRPHHWIKSGFCLAALFLSGMWSDLDNWKILFPMLIGFSLVSSSGYIFNDVLNVKEDRSHPRKRYRPIARGAVNRDAACVGCFFLSGLGFLFLIASDFFGKSSFAALISGVLYFLLTLSYSAFFRKISYLDVAVLGLGFVLRVVAGAFVLGLKPTWWLMGTTYALALLLGFGKRLGEVQLAEKAKLYKGETRASLCSYSTNSLRNIVVFAGFIVIGFYLAYCLKERGERVFFSLTLIPVVTGVYAYLRMAWRTDEVEMPEKLFLRSRVLVLSMFTWVVLILVVQ